MEIISFITEHLASATDCILVMWFMISYYGQKKKMQWWKYVFWFIALFIPSCMNEKFNLQCIELVVVTFLFSYFELKGKAIEKLIAALILFIMIAFINVGVIQAVSVLSKTPIETLIMPGTILRILVLCISKVTLGTLLYFIEHGYNKEHYFKKEEYILGVALYTIFFIMAIVSARIMGTVELSFKDQLSFFSLAILLLIINLFLFWLIRKISYQNRCEMENTILKVQLEQQENQIGNTEMLYQNARKMRHDMKHYFITYLQLLNDGEIELVKEEMKKALDTKFDVESIYYMENKLLNAVLNQKATICKELGIQMDVQISGMFEWRNESNMAIMLSNLLDNAIEAEIKEEDKKEINLKLFTYKDDVNLIVENAIQESVLKKNPLLKTTKEDKKHHGIGMESIREIVKQEEGTIDILEERQHFIIHILIPRWEADSATPAIRA